MAEKQTNKERLKEITDSIEAGIRDLFQSEKYANYLRTMSRFHNYSVNNTLLIHSQFPNATLVAGFNKWRDKFNRSVKRGEKGIKIIAPTPFKRKIEEAKLDPDTNIPMRDDNGNIIMEEKEIKIPMFKPVTVFDVSQTEGEPLPSLASELKGDVQNFEVFMEALRRSAPVPVEFEEIAENMDGYFSRDRQVIAIREGMSEVQTVCAAVHEIAHATLHNYKETGAIDDKEPYEEIELFSKPALFTNERIDRTTLPEGIFCYDLRGSDDDPGDPVTIENRVVVNHAGTVITAEQIELPESGFLCLEDSLNFTGGESTLKQFYEENHPEQARKNRNTEEVEAESVSFAVCAYYGIETGENSFGYIANWSDGKELSELKASLETINKTASGLIDDIDRHYAEICKERGIDITVQPQEHTAKLDEYPVPDRNYTAKDLAQHGIYDTNLLPVSKDTASKLIEQDLTVYAVTYESTVMAFDRDEVESHQDGALFAIVREEWEQTDDFRSVVANRMNHQQEREAAFLNHEGDCFAIYQLKDSSETQNLRYEPLPAQGVDKKFYELVYTAPLPAGATLDTLWEQFNIAHPADYLHPSMSVSDIVAIKQDSVVSCYYVDRFAFTELHGFFQPGNHLKNAEMAMEDDYNMLDGVINNGTKQPTAAEPEQQVKSGQSISLFDLAGAIQREKSQTKQKDLSEKRPSVLAKLRRPLPMEQTKKTAPEKSAERGNQR